MSAYEFANPMVDGLAVISKGKKLVATHPLEQSEKQFRINQQQLELTMARKVQGMHAPLRLQMERKIVSKNGHLPFLPRHNASLNVLTGRDEMIGFDDYLGHPLDAEVMGQPHAMVERSLKLL